jgi:hypothetical protein
LGERGRNADMSVLNLLCRMIAPPARRPASQIEIIADRPNIILNQD